MTEEHGKLIEAIARRMCGESGFDFDAENDFTRSSNGDDDGQDHWLGLAQAALTAITTAGYAVVPVEPTEAMEEAARDVPYIAMGNGEYLEPDRADIYRAMISAAQGDGA